MTQRVGLLNGTNITYDKDLTAGLLAMLNPGVIEGLAVSGTGASANITAGKALIECTRTNGEKVMVFFENTANVGVDLTGTKKVYILVNQGKLDDGSSNAEDGTGIASIQTGASWPSGGHIRVASTASGVITDEREYVSQKKYLLKENNWRLLAGSGSGWTRIGRFIGGESARILVEYVGSPTYDSGGSIGPIATSTGKIALTIGNAWGQRNCDGLWNSEFGSSPISIVRVQKVNGDAYSWDIFIYHSGIYIHSTFFRISHSGTSFIPMFDGLGASNVDQPNGIYDIPQYIPGLSISSLTDYTGFTSQNDLFVIYDSTTGVNKKMSWQNLSKEIAKKLGTTASGGSSTPSSSGWTSSSVAVPRGGLASGILVIGNNAGYAHPSPTLQWSPDNTTWSTLSLGYPANIGTVPVNVIVPPGYVRYTCGNNGYNSGHSFQVQIF